MEKYIAALTDSGLYTLRVAKETIFSTAYMLNGNKVSDYLFKLEDGTEYLYNAKDSNKLFDNIEDCQKYIEEMNRL